MDFYRKRAIITLLLMVLMGGVLWYGNARLQIKERLPEFEKVLTQVAIETIKKEISLPPPLIASSSAQQGAPSQGGIVATSQSGLTRSGVVLNTNNERAALGLSALAENKLLNTVAEARAKDMFSKQYFEHVSPLGESASTVAEEKGYSYIAIGENIALGNFKSDRELVTAWMNSPGHRANIANTRYREIGVAVLQGEFEGHRSWIGVQIFALPLSACTPPDASLKLFVDSHNAELFAMKAQADTFRGEIEATPTPQNQEERAAYNKKVDEYNALIAQLNALIKETKNIVTTYNDQVHRFNACIEAH